MKEMFGGVRMRMLEFLLGVDYRSGLGGGGIEGELEGEGVEWTGGGREWIEVKWTEGQVKGGMWAEGWSSGIEVK
jgi:hypothetical protein